MAKTILTTNRGNTEPGTTTAASTQYAWMGQTSFRLSGTEAERSSSFRAGTLSKMYIRLTANGTTSGSSTIRTRKNVANGGMSVSIPFGQGGVYEDTTNTDTIANGDKMCYQIVTGAGGTLTISLMSVIYDATTNCISKQVYEGSSLAATAGAAATNYYPVSGDRGSNQTTENLVECSVAVASTWKNVYIYFQSNARTNATAFVLRKNQADTAISLSQPATTTTAIDSTANTVSFAANDEVDWRLTTGGTGTQTIVTSHLAIDCETSTQGFINAGAGGTTAEASVNFGVTNYFVMGGGLIEETTEANQQMKARETFTLSHLTINVRTNSTNSGSTTFRTRKNTANGNQSVSIPFGQAGVYVDTTNTDSVTANDLINYQLVVGGTSGAINIIQMAVWTNSSTLQNLERTVAQSLTITDANNRLQNNIRAFNQGLTVADADNRYRGRLTDTVQSLTIADANDRLRGKLAAVPQSLGITDANNRIAGRLRAIAQSLVLTDANNRIQTVIRDIAQSLTISDLSNRYQSLTHTISQSLIITDATNRLKNMIAGLAQALTITDANSRLTGKLKTIAQSLTVADSGDRLMGRLASLAQSLTITDSISKLYSSQIVKTISQTLTIVANKIRTDKLATKWTLTDQMSSGHRLMLPNYSSTGSTVNFDVDPATFGIIHLTLGTEGNPGVLDWKGGNHTWRLRVTTANANLSLVEIGLFRYDPTGVTLIEDTFVALEESLGTTGIKSGTFYKKQLRNPPGASENDIFVIEMALLNSAPTQQSFSYGVNVSPNSDEWDMPFASSGNLERTVSQSLALADANSRSVAWDKTLSQSLAVADANSRMMARLASFSQGLTVTHTSTDRLAAWIKATSQGLAIDADNIVRELAGDTERFISEVLTLAHTSTDRLAGRLRNISQGVTVADSHNRLTARLGGIAQALNLTDTTGRLTTRLRSLSQALTLADAPTRLINKVRAVPQSLGITDSIVRIQDVLRTIAQSVAITDTVSKIATISRQVTGQSLSIAADIVRSNLGSRIITQSLVVSDAISYTTVRLINVVSHKIASRFSRKVF